MEIGVIASGPVLGGGKSPEAEDDATTLIRKQPAEY